MFLSEPQVTSADLRFSLFGIPIRISAWFWLAALLFGWNICQFFAAGDQRVLLQYLLLWTGAAFLSILIHEMGHALVYRYFGQDTQVVLYHFGGLTIPSMWGNRGARTPQQQFLVSAAGPFAQLMFVSLMIAFFKMAGYSVPFPISSIGMKFGLYEGNEINSPLLFAVVSFLIHINIFWPILNLIPVPPLDGGQMVREGLLSFGVTDAARIANIIGVGVGGVIAWNAYIRGQPFLGIMFAMLAISCYQSISRAGRW